MLSANESDGDLILVTFVPEGGEPVRLQAQRAWTEIAAVLDANAAVPLHERVFGSLSAAPCVMSARRVVAQRRCEDLRLMPTYVEGLPADDSCGSLAGIHVIAARTADGTAGWLESGGRSCGRVVESRSARFLSLNDIGALESSRLTQTPAEDAFSTMRGAASALAAAGWSFGDVCRTWVYLRDILDWYEGFDAVQRGALEGVAASAPALAGTEVGGRNARGGHCTLDLLAARPREGVPFDRRAVHDARRGTATELGRAFGRGARLDLGSTRYVFLSGTASTDERGASIHAGDFRAQALRTLENLVTLLESEGAGLDDVRQATAFVKRPEDVEDFHCLAEACGLWDVPVVATIADTCREELLFEIDATAAIPIPADSQGAE
jgi:enamine deaminase RidA (YjgF/YER057c/UK114 family)